LSEHPHCCFCGGEANAETIDHVPSRTLFRDRKWPEGYIFPACKKCNEITRKSELLVAMLARIFPDAAQNQHKEQVAQLMGAVNNNFPGLLESMRVPASKKKRLIRERGIDIPEGQTSGDVGLFSIDDPRINAAVQQFSTKLFMALHYYQSKEILGVRGGIAFKWFTNTQNLDELLPRDVLAPLLKGFPELKREKTTLNDQFFYRYALADSKKASAFLIFFNQSIAMLGFIFPNIDDVRLPEGAIVLRPFNTHLG
jgi:hypothetical protein